MADRKRLTVSLPAADWDRIEAEALARNQKIGTYAAHLLLDRNTSPGARAAKGVTKWARCEAWLVTAGITIDSLKAKGYKTRSQVMDAARAAGWEG